MIDTTISFEIRKNTYNEFIIDLYKYILEYKKCFYVKLIFDINTFNKLDKNILNYIFESYTYEKLIDSQFYLDNLYDEANDYDDDINYEDLFSKAFGECVVEHTSYRDNIIVEGIITDLSYSNIEIIQKLKLNQIMFFTESNNYNSIILGVYDYQAMYSISKVDANDIDIIKKLFSSKFDIKNLELEIYEYEINE